MEQGKRPGGLTALAVINFVFGGFDLLNVLSLVALAVMVSYFDLENPEEKQQETEQAQPAEDERAEEEKGPPDDPQEAIAEAWAQTGLGMAALIIMAAAYVALGGLLIASGVGYLKQRRVLGRGMGNLYAVVSIATTAYELTITPKDIPGGGFTILALIAFLYPLVTLILLNTTFKEDFVR